MLFYVGWSGKMSQTTRHSNKGLKDMKAEPSRTRGKRVLGRGNSQCKGPGVNVLVCLRNSEEEALWLEWSEGVSRRRGGKAGDKQIV